MLRLSCLSFHILRRNLLIVNIIRRIPILLSSLPLYSHCDLWANAKVELIVEGYIFPLIRAWPNCKLFVLLIRPRRCLCVRQFPLFLTNSIYYVLLLLTCSLQALRLDGSVARWLEMESIRELYAGGFCYISPGCPAVLERD